MKVVLLGAGSYVFGPAMLEQALLDHRFETLELWLVDPDLQTLELMTGVAERIVAETDYNVRIQAHSDRRTALPGADYVIASVAMQIRQRFETDVRLIREHAPTHLITEFGGVAGISHTLRQAELIGTIADDLKEHCPKAVFINVANPLPRVCAVAHARGVRTVGLCSVSLMVHRLLAHLLDDTKAAYPFEAQRAAWQPKRAGLNHFSWLLEVTSRTGDNLMPRIHERLQAVGLPSAPLTHSLFSDTGFLLTPGDDHIRDFLTPQHDTPSLELISHGTASARRERLALLQAIVNQGAPWEPLFMTKSWERPFDLIAALSGQRIPFELDAINLPNRGLIANLPADVFVEVPARVSPQGIDAEAITLPSAVQALCERTAHVNHLVVEGALKRTRAPLYQALELDPTVTDKRACTAALEACLEAHADMIPAYN